MLAHESPTVIPSLRVAFKFKRVSLTMIITVPIRRYFIASDALGDGGVRNSGPEALLRSATTYK